MHVLGIAGSLRRGSTSRALVRAASTLASDGVQVVAHDIGALPLYDGDIDTDDARPDAVRALKDAIASADALLLVTPEYNYSMSGVLKNAIDWVSRPAYKSVFVGKPVAIVGVSAGPAGGARALAHLKDVLLGVLARPLSVPDVLVPNARAVVDAEGALIDEAVRERLTRLLADLRAEVARAAK